GACSCGGACPRCGVRTKATIGGNGDRYEREADRIADRIGEAGASTSRILPRLQGQSDAGVDTVPENVQRGIATPSAGEPLAPTMRRFMEPRLGANLGDVRVHRDAHAESMNQSIHARAFTHGSHIWLGSGETIGDAKLMAHELVHTVQQRGADAAPAVQRTPKVAGYEWVVDHSDVDGNDEVTAINVAVSYLGINDTLAQFYGWMLEDRPLWSTKKGLYVRAIDFLRDNRDLFGVPDVNDMLGRVLDFCDASKVSVASLNDAFYEDLLVSAVYSAGPGSTEFTHRSFPLDPPHKIPARPAGSTDFKPSGNYGALLRTDPKPVKPLTGGVGKATDVLIKYGAAPGSIASKEATALIDKYKKRIPSRLRSPLSELATDAVIYKMLELFFGTDGGQFKLESVGMGGAHYTPGKKPQIEVDEDLFPGSGKDREHTPIALRTTIAHELYHYVMDRADAFHTERGAGGGGADHALIQVVEERYHIVEVLRLGVPLLDEKINMMDGWVGQDYKPDLRNFIQTNDTAGLRTLVRQADFIENLVFTKMSPTLSSNENAMAGKAGSKRSNTMFDPSQVTDLVYLSAINAIIIQKSYVLAAEIADRKKVTLSEVWADTTYKREMQMFIDGLISLAAGNRDEGILARVAHAKL
ncbi:MAG TPA: DUF4157 domain-containing protein, partial [Burkholderiales bacterium]|nr:DUF4157 domain-containing protein [Burkholderiales bacterium]